MATETMIWLNTALLIVAAIVEIPVVIYGFVTMHAHLQRARVEGEAHAERLAAILDAISRRAGR